jgi:hypothetical protein
MVLGPMVSEAEDDGADEASSNLQNWPGQESLVKASSKITALLRVITERPIPLLMEEEVSF